MGTFDDIYLLCPMCNTNLYDNTARDIDVGVEFSLGI